MSVTRLPTLQVKFALIDNLEARCHALNMMISLLLVLMTPIANANAFPEALQMPPVALKRLIRKEEARLGIPSGLLVAICTIESGLKPRALNKHDGRDGTSSYGVCQLKGATASLMGWEGPYSGLYNPQVNARYAALYLTKQYKRYGSWEMAVVAYNMGRVKLLSDGGYANRGYLRKVYRVWLK